MTPDGITRLQRDEAEGGKAVLFVYDDATARPIKPGDKAGSTVGYATIGFGRNLCTRGITPAEAAFMFANDLAMMEVVIINQFPRIEPLLDTVRGDVVTMVNFNSGSLTKWPKFMAAVQADAWPQAMLQLLNSDAARKLVPRYQRMAKALMANSWQGLLD